MKIDLHVHSKHSRRPSEWILQKLGSPESFTEPMNLYRVAKQRGMSLVTITDHNAIEGCLELGDMPDTFVSEEVTTYFPEDGCKLHVVVYNIDEMQHREIQSVRDNVYDLLTYLSSQNVPHVLAHPLYSVNNRLTIDHVEKALLLFKNFELNAARSRDQNQSLRLLLSNLTPELLDELANKHDMEPRHREPWKKNFTGGSDDHSSLTIARRCTHVPGAASVAEFFAGLDEGRSEVLGPESSPKTLSHNIYSIAYQYYGNKLHLDRYVSSDVMFSLLSQFLLGENGSNPTLRARLTFYWNQRMRRRDSNNGNRNMLTVVKQEAHQLIWDDPDISALLHNGNGKHGDLDEKWFSFVNKISNKVLCHFADHIIDSAGGAHFLNLFGSLGSAGALYAIMAPYFVSYSLFSRDRQFTRSVLERFGHVQPDAADNRINVAHFTDTFYEVNGVAGTLRKQIAAARKAGKDYTVITCNAENRPEREGVRNFMPISSYELPVYPEQKLLYPPFLEMLDYCYHERFSLIHSATPGPLGLAALAIARILRLPIYGTYHTALPQYAQYLTNDSSVAEMMWRYVVWYYDQMDLIYVPSVSTAAELAEKGIAESKIKIFPRGVDTELFNPLRRNGCLGKYGVEPGTVTLLYVGRISKEKNLDLLVRAYKKLSRTTGNLSLVVVGDGPYTDEMRESLRGTKNVFTGYIEGEALASVYASADLFVFPSTTDTFGNVVLEAQASGIPVVVTNSGGPQENIVPETTGIVVQGNDEKSLLQGMERMLSDPERLKVMGRAARDYAETRTFDRAFENTWNLYATPMAQHG